MKAYLLLATVIVASIVTAVILFTNPARAEECQGIPEVVGLIEDNGGTFIDLVDVNGEGFDQLIVADFGGAIVIGRAMLGCAVGGPMVIGLSIPAIGV